MARALSRREFVVRAGAGAAWLALGGPASSSEIVSADGELTGCPRGACAS